MSEVIQLYPICFVFVVNLIFSFIILFFFFFFFFWGGGGGGGWGGGVRVLFNSCWRIKIGRFDGLSSAYVLWLPDIANNMDPNQTASLGAV